MDTAIPTIKAFLEYFPIYYFAALIMKQFENEGSKSHSSGLT